jgi:putative ABC transport system permease protein
LQLVLSAVYHVDAPTGNISMSDVAKIRRNPMIKQTIPLAYGDSYQTYRIVGTDTSYIGKYEAKLQSGRLFDNDLEVVLGASVAQTSGLSVGQSFHSTHGQAAEGEVHDAFSYTVVGILEPSGTVLDQLILCNVSSVWKVHETAHEHEADEQDQGTTAQEPATEEEEPEITALLVKFRSPMGIMTLPRMVNETTQMQAAVPALEINRLLGLMGIGIATLQILAIAIMLISGFSVFITLYNRLKERRYELALLRSLGCSRGQLFFLLIAEGALLALAGAAGGFLLSRLGLWVLNRTAAKGFHLVFQYDWIAPEAWLLLAACATGLLAALIPAIKAYRMELSKALAEG